MIFPSKEANKSKREYSFRLSIYNLKKFNLLIFFSELKQGLLKICIIQRIYNKSDKPYSLKVEKLQLDLFLSRNMPEYYDLFDDIQCAQYIDFNYTQIQYSNLSA